MKKKKVINKSKESKNGVLLEELNHKFDLVLEYASDIPSIKGKVTGLENKVDGLTEDMAIVKTSLEFVKNSLKKKVDADEFAILEHRVALLENRSR